MIALLGFIEDISESINPRLRAILSSLIIIMIITIFNYTIISVEIPIVDYLREYLFFLFLYVFMYFVSIHSYNLIDGLNGLSAGYATVVLIVLLLLFTKFDLTPIQNDYTVSYWVFVWFFYFKLSNTKIFLGDSGSYFLGLVIAILSIIASNLIQDISPWFFALLYLYPVTEVLVTLSRRMLALKSLFNPDFLHLHSLIFTYLNEKKLLIIRHITTQFHHL